MNNEHTYRGHKIRKNNKGRYEAYTLLTPNGSHEYPTAKTLAIVKSMVDREMDKAARNT